MAFNFEQYLLSYEPETVDFLKGHVAVKPGDKSYDDLSLMTKAFFSKTPRSLPTPCSLTTKESWNSGLPASVPNGKIGTGHRAMDVIEHRFRHSHHEFRTAPPPKGAKVGLFKQTSLPAFLETGRSPRTKTEPARKRRNSVKFADEMGENLTTFVMIPSRFDDIEHERFSDRDRYNDRYIDAYLFGDNEACKGLKPTQRNPAPTDDTSSFVGDSDGFLSSPGDTTHQCGYRTESKTTAKTEQCLPANDLEEDGKPCAASTPSFQLCFDQPAASFSDFQRRLHLQFICLENVKVDVKLQQGADGTARGGRVSHGTVLCSIRVRNIHPVKRVFARCTDNNWKSHADINAVYVDGGLGSLSEYDTFSFALKNPLMVPGGGAPGAEESGYCRKTAAVEFALCYEVLRTSYWDNNDGQNYRIVWI